MTRSTSPDDDTKPIARRTRGRGRIPKPEKQRKAKVIQTRVPEDLESTLKEAAEKRRMTVSHLIRNVLEDTFTLVDNIVADSSALVEQVSRDAKKVASSVRGEGTQPGQQVTNEALLDSIDSWQEVIVNKPTQCAQCDEELKRGKKAYRGLSSAQSTSLVWLCHDCLENL